uniref:FAD-binding domain-containing protein n=1 Tax=Aegilops tauschii subsp. strangulata TaxID=200361 RepID=A0A453LS85_AEGTS
MRPVRRPRPRRLPGRPRHEEGAPAVPLGGPEGQHGAHQRDGGLLVPRQQHRRRGRGRSRRGPGQEPKILREVTNNLGRHMPAEYLDVVRHSDHNSVSWAPLLYRSPWSILTGPAGRGSATVARDAFHPMTADLAQGGCSALEDAVVLARALSRAATPAEGVAAYVSERRGRAAWLVAGAYLSGWVQQGGTDAQGLRGYFVKLFRDLIFYRFIFPKLADTLWYDCGDLVPPQSKEKGKNHLE